MSLWLLEHHPRGKNSQFTVSTTLIQVCDYSRDRNMVYFYNVGPSTVEILRNPMGVYGKGIPIAAGTDKTYTAFIADDTENPFYAIVTAATADLRIEEALEPD